MSILSIRRVLALLPGVLASLLGPAVAFAGAADARTDYLQTIERVCDRGVAPGAVAPVAAARHAELLAALAREAARTDVASSGLSSRSAGTHTQLVRLANGTHGQTANFWAPRSPEHALAECVQPR